MKLYFKIRKAEYSKPNHLFKVIASLSRRAAKPLAFTFHKMAEVGYLENPRRFLGY